MYPLGALVALSRHCVRRTLHSNEFPVASPLPSTASAARVAALFGDFVGTMELSDFPRPFIIGVVLRLPDALCRSCCAAQSRGISRFPHKVCPYMRQVSRPRGVLQRLAMAAPQMLPSAFLQSVGTPK
jgi:hypothetical protein